MVTKIILLMMLLHANYVRSGYLDIARSYETTLDKNNPEVNKFAREMYEKSLREANSPLILDSVEIEKAQVQIVGIERRYIILSKIVAHFDFEGDPKLYRFCYIHIFTQKSSQDLMKCFREFINPNFRNNKVSII